MESEINPQVHGELIFYKYAKVIQWGKDSLYKRRWETQEIHMGKNLSFDSYFTPYNHLIQSSL